VTRLLALLLFLAGCPHHAKPPPIGPSTQNPPPRGPNEPTIAWKRVETAADMPAPPQPGHFQVHLIDVGTGLSILIRGADFTMLYDAGTNDREEKPLRVVSYLTAALGASGDDLCGSTPAAERRKINHVVLSHPHLDHASALDLVVHCFEVHDFWDSGRINEAVFYRELIASLAAEPITQYHTAASVPGDHKESIKGLGIIIPHWQRFSEGDVVTLGEGARFTILHAEPKNLPDANQNSVVLAVELGGAHLLLVGDSESGERKDPTYPAGDVEEFLLDHHKGQIRADILQVGHHGSKTSSRRAFLEAVAPHLALVSSGPKMYGSVTLPDHEVIEELQRIHATILRTDERDASCPVHDRIGGDGGPGGCDSWVITIDPPTP